MVAVPSIDRLTFVVVLVLLLWMGSSVVAEAWRCPLYVGPPPGTFAPTGAPTTTTAGTTTTAPPTTTTPGPTTAPRRNNTTTPTTTPLPLGPPHSWTASLETPTPSVSRQVSPDGSVTAVSTPSAKPSSTPSSSQTTRSPTMYSLTFDYPRTATPTVSRTLSLGTLSLSSTGTHTGSASSTITQSASRTETLSLTLTTTASLVATSSVSLTHTKPETRTSTKSRTTQIITNLHNWGLLTPASNGEIIVDGCVFRSDIWTIATPPLANGSVSPCLNSQPIADPTGASGPAPNATTTILRVDVLALGLSTTAASAVVRIEGAVFMNDARIDVVGVSVANVNTKPISIIVQRCTFNGTATYGTSGITITQHIPLGSTISVNDNTVNYVFSSNVWNCGNTGSWVLLRAFFSYVTSPISIVRNTVTISTLNIGGTTLMVPTTATSGAVLAVASGIATNGLDIRTTGAITISSNTFVSVVRNALQFAPATDVRNITRWHYPMVSGVYISGTTAIRADNGINIKDNTATASILYTNTTTFPASGASCTVAYPVAASFLSFGPNSQTYLFKVFAVSGNSLLGVTSTSEATPISYYQWMSSGLGNCVDSSLIVSTRAVGPSGIALISYFTSSAVATSSSFSFTRNSFVIGGQKGTVIISTTAVMAAYYLAAKSSILTLNPGSMTLTLNTYDIKDEDMGLLEQKTKGYEAYATALDIFGCNGMCMLAYIDDGRQFAVWAQASGSSISVGSVSTFTMQAERATVRILIPQFRGAMISLIDGSSISAKGIAASVIFRSNTFVGIAGEGVVAANFYRQYLKAVAANTPILANTYARIGRFGLIMVHDLLDGSFISADSGATMEWDSLVYNASSQGGRAAFIALAKGSSIMVSASSTMRVANCNLAIKVSSDVYRYITPFSDATARALSQSATLVEQGKARALRTRYAALMDVRDTTSSIAISQQSSFIYSGSTITVAAVPALEPVVLCVSPHLDVALPNVSTKMFGWSEVGKTDRWSTGTAIGVSIRNGAMMNITGVSEFTIVNSKMSVFGVDHVGGVEIGYGSLLTVDQYSKASLVDSTWNVGGHMFGEGIEANPLTNTTSQSRPTWYQLSTDDAVCGFSSTATPTETLTTTISMSGNTPTASLSPTETLDATPTHTIPPTSTQPHTSTPTQSASRSRISTRSDQQTPTSTLRSTFTQQATPTHTHIVTSTPAPTPTLSSPKTHTLRATATSTPRVFVSVTKSHSATLLTKSHSATLLRRPSQTHQATPSAMTSSPTVTLPSRTPLATITIPLVPSRTGTPSLLFTPSKSLPPTATNPKVPTATPPSRTPQATNTQPRTSTLTYMTPPTQPHTHSATPSLTPTTKATLTYPMTGTNTLAATPTMTHTATWYPTMTPPAAKTHTVVADATPRGMTPTSTMTAALQPSYTNTHTGNMPPHTATSSRTHTLANTNTAVAPISTATRTPTPRMTPTDTPPHSSTTYPTMTPPSRTDSPAVTAAKTLTAAPPPSSTKSSSLTSSETASNLRTHSSISSKTPTTGVAPVTSTPTPTASPLMTMTLQPAPTASLTPTHTSTGASVTLGRTSHTQTNIASSTPTTMGMRSRTLSEHIVARPFAAAAQQAATSSGPSPNAEEDTIRVRNVFEVQDVLSNAPTWSSLEPTILALSNSESASDTIVYLLGFINGGALVVGGNSTLKLQRNKVLVSGPFITGMTMWVGVNSTSQGPRIVEHQQLLKKTISQFMTTPYFDTTIPGSLNRYPDPTPIYELSPKVKFFNTRFDNSMFTGGINGSVLFPPTTLPSTNGTTPVGYTFSERSTFSVLNNDVDVFSLYGVAAFWYRRGSVSLPSAESLTPLRATGNSTIEVKGNAVRVRGLWGALGIHSEGPGAAAYYEDSNITITFNTFALNVAHSYFNSPAGLGAFAAIYPFVGNRWSVPVYMTGNGQLLLLKGSSAIFMGHCFSSYMSLIRTSEVLRGNTINATYNVDKLWVGVRARLDNITALTLDAATYTPRTNGLEMPCALYVLLQYSTVTGADRSENIWSGNNMYVYQNRLGSRGAEIIPSMTSTNTDGVIQYSFPFVLKSISAYGFLVDTLSLLEVIQRGSFFINGSNIHVVVARAPITRAPPTQDTKGNTFANPLSYTTYGGDAYLFFASNGSSAYIYRDSQITIADNKIVMLAMNGTAAIFMAVDANLWQFRSSSVHLIQRNTVDVAMNSSNFAIPFASFGAFQSMSWIDYSSSCVNENHFINVEVPLIIDMMAWYRGSAFGMRDNTFVNSSTAKLRKFLSSRFTILPGTNFKLPRAKQVTCRNTMNNLPMNIVFDVAFLGTRVPDLKEQCSAFPKCSITDGTSTQSFTVSISTTVTPSFSTSESITSSLPETATLSLSSSTTISTTLSLSGSQSISTSHTLSTTTSLSDSTSLSPTGSISDTITVSESVSSTVFITSWCDRVKRPVLESWYTNSTNGNWELDLVVLKGEKPERVSLGLEPLIEVTDEDIRNGTAIQNKTIILPLPGAPRFIEYRKVEVQIAYRHMIYDYILPDGDGDRGVTTPGPSQPNPTGFQKFGMVYAEANFQGRGLINITLPPIPFYEIDSAESVVLRMSLREFSYCDDGAFVIATMNIRKASTTAEKFRTMSGAATAAVGVLSLVGGSFAATIDLQVMATFGLVRCSPVFLQTITGVTLRTFSPVSLFKAIVNVNVPTLQDLRSPKEAMDDGDTFYQTLLGVIIGSGILLAFVVGLQVICVLVSSLFNAGFTRARKWGRVWAPAAAIMVAFALFTGVLFSGVMLLTDSGTLVQPFDAHTGISFRTVGTVACAAAITFFTACVFIPICCLSVEYHEVDFSGECITDRAAPLELDAIIMEILDTGDLDDGLEMDDISSNTKNARDKQIRARRRSKGGGSCCGDFWKSLFHPSGISMPNKTRRQFYPLTFHRRCHNNPALEVVESCKRLVGKNNETQGERVKRLSQRPRAIHGYLHVWSGFTAVFPMVSPLLLCAGLAIFNSIAPQDPFLAPKESASYTALIAIDFGIRIFDPVAVRFESAMAAGSVSEAQAILDTSTDNSTCFNWHMAIAVLHFALGLIVLIWRFWPARLLNLFSGLSLFVNGGISVVCALTMNDVHNDLLKGVVTYLVLVQGGIVVVRVILQCVLWYCDYRLSLGFKDYTPQTNLNTAQDRKQHFSIVPMGDEDVETATSGEETDAHWCGGRVFPQRVWYHRCMHDRRVFTKRDEALATAMMDLDMVEQTVVFDHAAVDHKPRKGAQPDNGLHSPLVSPREYNDVEMQPISPMAPRRLGKGRIIKQPQYNTQPPTSFPAPPMATRHGKDTDTVDIDLEEDM